MPLVLTFRPRGRRRIPTFATAVALTATLAIAVPGLTASAAAIDDPRVITDWNAVAVATIVVDAGKANPEAFYWYAIEQAAVYNAVVGITRRYELYRWNQLGPKWASPEAAAAAAAHRVLLEYFPASEPRLSDALAASLDAIPDGDAKDRGITYGRRAARHIITQRADDGRFANVTFDRPLAPGVWRPTPPTFAPFFDPWLSKVDPFILQSPSHLRPGPPPALGSDRYTREYREVKRLGSKTSTRRTDAQTQTALFFSDIGVGPLQAGLRDLATRREMDISQSARLFAAVDLSLADAVITTWDAKLRYGFWRPVTAIRLGDHDRNPDTIGDENWEPLVVTPPYAEYPSGLTAVMAAAGRTIAGILPGPKGHIDLNLISVAAGETRHYSTKGALTRDAVGARVWSGIHFKTADVVGARMGTRIGRRVLSRFERTS